MVLQIVVALSLMAAKVQKINSIVEKPSIEDAPSNLAVVGRYVFFSSNLGFVRKNTNWCWR